MANLKIIIDRREVDNTAVVQPVDGDDSLTEEPNKNWFLVLGHPSQNGADKAGDFDFTFILRSSNSQNIFPLKK